MASRRGGIGRQRVPGKYEDIYLASAVRHVDWKRIASMLAGVVLFLIVYLSPSWTDAVDPEGTRVQLTGQGKAAIGLFLLAATWWVFEVVPIGVTGIVIGIVQALCSIRPGKAVFTDFMDPSVWFIFGSLVIGMVCTKTGLAQRTAYKMLTLLGERTSFIYLGCFLMTATMTLYMAHTAVAATLFPFFMAIYALYEEDNRPTRFGKGLFIGMAFAAGAGSVVTLLGSGRAPIAMGFFKELVGREVAFLPFSYYMFPLGWGMVILVWLLILVVFRPEKSTIPGLSQRAKDLYSRLGPLSRSEILTLIVTGAVIAALMVKPVVHVLEGVDNSAIILAATVAFFVAKILTIKDLQEIPWNIIFLFGGAMSMGYCLWETHAAQWLGVKCVKVFLDVHWLVFVLVMSLCVLVAINIIMNVAIIAIVLPVGLVMAGYLGVKAELVMFSCLVASGMPFLHLIGAAPNAIAYGSNQFSAREFFMAGVLASILVLIVLAVCAYSIWPLMGMPALGMP